MSKVNIGEIKAGDRVNDYEIEERLSAILGGGVR